MLFCDKKGRAKDDKKTFKLKCPRCKREKIYLREKLNLYNRDKKKKRLCMSCSARESQIQRYWGISYDEHLRRMERKKLYYKTVWDITKTVYKKLLNSEKRNHQKIKGSYGINHIVPISYGFSKNISPELIGSLTNLEMIPNTENSKLKNRLTNKSKKILKSWKIKL